MLSTKIELIETLSSIFLFHTALQKMFSIECNVFGGVLCFVTLHYEETNGNKITLRTEEPILDTLKTMKPQQSFISFINGKTKLRLIWEQYQIRIMLEIEGIEIETRIPTTEEKLSSLHKCLAEWKRLAFPE